jgi:hypothetical protein
MEQLEKKREYDRAWRARSRESVTASRLRWESENREKIKKRGREYYARNAEKCGISARRWVDANRVKVRDYIRSYRKKNVGIVRALNAKRRSELLARVVGWSDLTAIREFYRKCPPGMVVDHIIPLRGKNVCGLHVLSNLQYLTAEENIKKRNHFDHDAVSA